MEKNRQFLNDSKDNNKLPEINSENKKETNENDNVNPQSNESINVRPEGEDSDSNNEKDRFGNIWQRFRGSLLFDVIKACALVFVLVFSIYLIKPYQAQISVSISELVDNEVSFIARNAIFNNLDYNEIVFSNKNAIRIKLEAYEVEEFPSLDSGLYWLVINPSKPNGTGLCRFVLSGKIKEIDLYDVSSTNLHSFNTERTELLFDGPQHIEIIEGSAVIEKSNGEKYKQIGDSINIVERKNNKPNILNMRFDILNNAEKIEYLTLSYVDIESSSTLDFEEDNNSDQINQSLYVGLNYNSGKLKINDMKFFKSKVSGKLALSYTLVPQEYNLNMQELKLASGTNSQGKLKLKDFEEKKDSNKSELLDRARGELYMELHIKHSVDDYYYESEGTLNGYITDGEVSKMPLFPSFCNWFYSNVYMTPTTIITIIITAITLFNRKK